MTTSFSERVYSAESRRVFAALLHELECGRELDLERACAAHPEIASELCSLHSSWQRVGAALERLTPADVGREDSRADRTRTEQATRRFLDRLADADLSRSRYRVEEEIARGGMGVVLRVHDSVLERDLAMKLVLDPDGAGIGASRRLARFFDEARLTGRLDHPGIVPIHDAGLDAHGRLYFTMPLIRGRKLGEVIDLVHAARDGWTLARALEAVLKVCDAVEYAHSLGVVHRDLKPDNVMIGRFGETYVMDWGLARVVDRDDEMRDVRSTRSTDDAREQDSLHAPREHATADGAVLGTPAYMSPEQADGRSAGVGPQSDVYSAGAILYHLLCGRAPYAAGETNARAGSILDAVRAGPPPRVESIAARTSPELAAICAKAMARSPSERYADMRAMSDDLRAYMEGRVVRAHDGGALAELEKWIARNRGLAAAIAAAIFVAFGGLAAVSYVQTSSKNEILKLSDLRRVETLVREAATLWPAVPEKIGAMERWLGEAEALVANRDLHERTLAEMNERSGTLVPESIERSDSSSPDSNERADPSARDSVERSDRSAPGSKADSTDSLAASIDRSASNADRWRFENQSKLVSALERFADSDPKRGLIANVRERLADARVLRRASIDEHAAEWRAAIASIANESECPAYRGLAIAPQIGLVPLGRDPRSKLWEFAHLASGAPPRRSGDGVLELTESTGIVLVLIPGGRTTIGSQPPKSGRPSDPLTDSLSQPEEEPPREIELAPFFISKYELTEVQWRRWCERDPDVMDAAFHAPTIDRTAHVHDRENSAGDVAASANATDALAPMGSIAWLEAERVTAHMGLALPTEAQWEHAARAGTRTRWWCGNEPRLLLEAANVGSGIDGSLPYADGFEGPAPIGALRANPFGLHDVHGNVSEWTADSYWPDHDRALRAGDGLALAPDSGLRSVRGGSYRGSAASARSAARVGVAAENHDATIGVRAARDLDP